jgi:hypothetical protein
MIIPEKSVYKIFEFLITKSGSILDRPDFIQQEVPIITRLLWPVIKLFFTAVCSVMLVTACNQQNSVEDKSYQALYRLKNLQSRAASAENPTAAPGKGGMTAYGLKGSPAIKDFKDT